MIVNLADREVSFKIVYYGPGLCGKTTNLLRIYSRLDKGKGELVNLANKEDRTIFFDFASLNVGRLGGLMVKFSLYTVPGQSLYKVTRKLVLKGVDGLVFVADSSPARFKANVLSLQEMSEYLKEVAGVFVKDIPLVIQYNKRDLADAVPLKLLERINVLGMRVPAFESVATEGKGVMETFNAIMKMVLQRHGSALKGTGKGVRQVKELG